MQSSLKNIIPSILCLSIQAWLWRDSQTKAATYHNFLIGLHKTVNPFKLQHYTNEFETNLFPTNTIAKLARSLPRKANKLNISRNSNAPILSARTEISTHAQIYGDTGLSLTQLQKRSININDDF